jgi:hypothetical protein
MALAVWINVGKFRLFVGSRLSFQIFGPKVQNFEKNEFESRAWNCLF